MADRVFCIDFGSAYTKVALRRDPGADSELLTRQRSSSTEADFCFPTTVAVDRRGPKAVPEFGDRASTMLVGGGVEIYRNWKKSIFLAHISTAKTHQSPLESLLQSEELRELASRHEVLPLGTDRLSPTTRRSVEKRRWTGRTKVISAKGKSTTDSRGFNCTTLLHLATTASP